ncbi:hypothetical protein EVAR_6255_1 [Eumeta japonica]|uniref:Uncharacterized protein n=1 Tax=Eumeta variegata TaxID=151549 RepID=A0A4C1TAU2_EUMVA|nr:hypothetical protein EVAR_6255_1 [Eumeta japonica]
MWTTLVSYSTEHTRHGEREYGCEVAASAVAFRPVSESSGGPPTVTNPGLRMSMSGVDNLLSGGSLARLTLDRTPIVTISRAPIHVYKNAGRRGGARLANRYLQGFRALLPPLLVQSPRAPADAFGRVIMTRLIIRAITDKNRGNSRALHRLYHGSRGLKYGADAKNEVFDVEKNRVSSRGDMQSITFHCEAGVRRLVLFVRRAARCRTTGTVRHRSGTAIRKEVITAAYEYLQLQRSHQCVVSLLGGKTLIVNSSQIINEVKSIDKPNARRVYEKSTRRLRTRTPYRNSNKNHRKHREGQTPCHCRQKHSFEPRPSWGARGPALARRAGRRERVTGRGAVNSTVLFDVVRIAIIEADSRCTGKENVLMMPARHLAALSGALHLNEVSGGAAGATGRRSKEK